MVAVGIDHSCDDVLVVRQGVGVARQCSSQGGGSHQGGIEGVEQTLGRKRVAGEGVVAYRQPAGAGGGLDPTAVRGAVSAWAVRTKIQIGKQGGQVGLFTGVVQQRGGADHTLCDRQIRVGVEGQDPAAAG